jgi:hypothetical protein
MIRDGLGRSWSPLVGYTEGRDFEGFSRPDVKPLGSDLLCLMEVLRGVIIRRRAYLQVD